MQDSSNRKSGVRWPAILLAILLAALGVWWYAHRAVPKPKVHTITQTGSAERDSLLRSVD